MGIIRKTMSVSTAGLIDFRSDKERAAAYGKGTRKEARKQTKLMEQQLAVQQAAATQAVAAPVAVPMPVPAQAPAPQLPPAGWYQDANNPAVNRWFDGTQWTDHVQPVNAPPAP